LQTYFAEPWIAERDRCLTVDREIEVKDLQLHHSVKRIRPVVYGELVICCVAALIIIMYWVYWVSKKSNPLRADCTIKI